MYAIREGVAVAAGFLLSCGPSQVYGIVKGCLDLTKLAKLHEKIASIDSAQAGKTTAVMLAKRTKYASKYESKLHDLLADGVALIPFAGAILSWRVFSGSWRAPSSDIIEHAIPQMLGDHSKSIAKVFYPQTGSGDVARKGNQEIPVIDTSGVRMLDAVYTRHNIHAPRPTVVVFHGNDNIGPDMQGYINFYFNQGYDVLSPTAGGYPGSDNVKTCEESTYRDVEGIKTFLQSQRVTQVGYHGVSIGGTFALQAATANSAATKLRTKFVVADQTFNNAKEVAANVTHNLGYSSVLLPFVRGAARTAFPSGRKILLSEGVYTETDGLDNARKAKILREKGIPLFVIESSDDCLMKRPEGNLSDDLLHARYNKKKRASHRCTLEAGHYTPFMSYEHATKQMKAFLQKTMLA